MNVIGFSGLHYGVPFKRREFPALSQRDYYNTQGADSAAALVTDAGIIAAAAEERFSRIKHTGSFPAGAIAACLAAGGLDPRDIDVFAHGFDYKPFESFYRTPSHQRRYAEVYSPEAQLRALEERYPGTDLAAKFVAVPHHLAHAASAFCVSGYQSALVLIVDGMGEAYSTTVAVANESGIEVLLQNPGSHSLGHLYGFVTLHLGFVMGSDEYKVMGLAPYGDPRRFHHKLKDLVKLKPDGSFTIPLLQNSRTAADDSVEVHREPLAKLAELLGPARAPDGEVTQLHKDIAAGLQAALQDCLFHILKIYRERTGLTDLCMAGGVALNCTANGAILRSGMFERMFVQPAAGDDGTALGAALYVHHKHKGTWTGPAMTLPLWGPGFETDAIRTMLAARTNIDVREVADPIELADATAADLAAGRIVAWFQGRMEYGPRALGSRSILADPRNPTMRDKINSIVKKREAFRPFAPIVKAESAGRYFAIEPGQERTFANMLFVADVRPEFREQLPAITHVNGSARVQTLARDDHPVMWNLLDAWERLVGMSVLLNTSFNVAGQPIVCKPEEALDTFLAHDLDRLVLDRFIVTRRAS